MNGNIEKERCSKKNAGIALHYTPFQYCREYHEQHISAVVQSKNFRRTTLQMSSENFILYKNKIVLKSEPSNLNQAAQNHCM
jgi:hypothetical protein